MTRFLVRKVAVLGAGVMGAQIAAHLTNVGVSALLFDVPAKEGAKNAVVQKAIDHLQRLKPAPLGLADFAARIVPANYEADLALLGGCDLVIEAIAERMDFKRDLYTKIAPHIAAHTVLASNTSGLSIEALSQALPAELRPRFCGIHFFNPPRYMRLVELIPTRSTEAGILDQLETFVVSVLGKGVVRAKDTPNFIANRIGVGGILSIMHEAERFGLSYDVVDDLTGKRLGRASSATYRTADVVGLDTLAHVIRTLTDNLSLERDPFYALYTVPAVLQTLIDQGLLGQKSQAGFFKKEGRDILRFDAASGDYVMGGAKADEVVVRMLKKPAAERLRLLRHSESAQGQFLWAVVRNSFHYAAVLLGAIAQTARDVDLAMRWGFGLQQGPFELWQDAGWQTVAQWLQEDIQAGKALCMAALPQWVFSPAVLAAGGVHSAQGSWNPSTEQFEPRRNLPVYARQIFPELLLGEAGARPERSGQTVLENEALRLWTDARHPALQGVLIASLKTKMHTLNSQALQGLQAGVERAEQEYQAFVLWPDSEPFSVGADLQELLPAFMQRGIAAVDEAEHAMQTIFMRLRYAQVPVVAAMRGMALGGGCEIALHCARRVAHVESYIGLVEMGVGLIPGAGGLCYLARRAAENASWSSGQDRLPFLSRSITQVALAQVSASAFEAQHFGYLQTQDVIVAHKDEVLLVAATQAKALAESGYRAPALSAFAVAGRSAKATITGQLVNMRDGGFISAHDFDIAQRIAHVLCGGDVDAGTLVHEDYLLKLEREAFCQLIMNPKTQARIMAMLDTGKPLRN